MTTLFCEEFEVCCPFIFNFYDFDKDGQISKEDIRTVLSYVSLSQEIQNYKDRVHSQKELYEILEICFSKIKGDKMGNRIILKFLNDLKIIKFRYIDYYKNSFFIFIFIMKNNK